MKYFKPEDFASSTTLPFWAHEAADAANLKLKQEGLVVHGTGPLNTEEGTDGWSENKYSFDKYKGLLINIHLIEECKHTPDKVSWFEDSFNILWWRCECGTVVEPTEFKKKIY